MRFADLLHVLRAAADISGEKSFVVVGSQALLLAIPSPDHRLTLSDEIDLYPALAPEKADEIDGAIGALSLFHETHGYHADGVSPDTAVMPADWMTRASFHYFGELTAICPELHDLCVGKCVAGREKDADFVRILLQDKHVSLATLVERIAMLDATKYPIQHITLWTQRRAKEATE
jgi:hypothetical protein